MHRVITPCWDHGLTREAQEGQPGWAVTCPFPRARMQQQEAGSGPDAAGRRCQGRKSRLCKPQISTGYCPGPPTHGWRSSYSQKLLTGPALLFSLGEKFILMPCSQMHCITIFNSSDHTWAGKYVITYVKYRGVSLQSFLKHQYPLFIFSVIGVVNLP